MLEPVRLKIVAGIERIVSTHRDLFSTYVGPRAVALLSDDDMVTKVGEEMYPLLPLPMRLIVKQDAFVSFLLGNRGRLVSILGQESETKSETDE